jgi:hypothetical protein
MTNFNETLTPHEAKKVFEGYIGEQEYADQRGVSLRTCQRDRSLRQSPPYVTVGKKVYYRIETVRHWLVSQEQKNDRVSYRSGGPS